MRPEGSLVQSAKKITLPKSMRCLCGKSMGKHERRTSDLLNNMGDAWTRAFKFH